MHPQTLKFQKQTVTFLQSWESATITDCYVVEAESSGPAPGLLNDHASLRIGLGE
jgi:hypothetical protein